MLYYKSMKRLLICFLFVIGLSLFSGCTSNASGEEVFYDIGLNISSIYITISYDEENLTDVGIDNSTEINLFKTNIEERSGIYIEELKLEYRNILSELYNDEKISSNQRIIYGNHLDFYCGWDDETYIVEMRFYSNIASKIFIRNAGATEDQVFEDKLLVRKVTDEYLDIFTSTPNDIITSTLSNFYNISLEEIIEDLSLEVDDFEGIDISYMFLSSNPRLHSSGNSFDTTGGNLHVFNEEDDSFAFYLVSPKLYVWYLLALTITMIFLAVLLIIIYFKKEKKELKIIDLDQIKEQIHKDNKF